MLTYKAAVGIVFTIFKLQGERGREMVCGETVGRVENIHRLQKARMTHSETYPLRNSRTPYRMTPHHSHTSHPLDRHTPTPPTLTPRHRPHTTTAPLQRLFAFHLFNLLVQPVAVDGGQVRVRGRVKGQG